MRFLFIALLTFFVFGTTLQSCSHSTCPTYSTSGPSKGVQKKIKKSRAAYSKSDKKAKSKKGKAIKGLDG